MSLRSGDIPITPHQPESLTQQSFHREACMLDAAQRPENRDEIFWLLALPWLQILW